MPFFRLTRLVAALLFAGLGAVALAAAPAEKSAAKRIVTYKLRPMDLIKVQVFQEQDLDRELRVSRDSTIVAPLVGEVDIRGLTVRQTEELLTALYRKDYIVNPQINITVTEYAPRTVNVLGAVNNPGSVPLPPEKELGLLDVIARSGGFSRLANRTKVSLTRSQPNGEVENFVVNTEQLVSGDNAARWLVQDGDIVYVGERVL
ncbi:MAG: polysaccharide biosynthesis/export family protein [Lacunisphaera sp.]